MNFMKNRKQQNIQAESSQELNNQLQSADLQTDTHTEGANWAENVPEIPAVQ